MPLTTRHPRFFPFTFAYSCVRPSFFPLSARANSRRLRLSDFLIISNRRTLSMLRLRPLGVFNLLDSLVISHPSPLSDSPLSFPLQSAGQTGLVSPISVCYPSMVAAPSSCFTDCSVKDAAYSVMAADKSLPVALKCRPCWSSKASKRDVSVGSDPAVTTVPSAFFSNRFVIDFPPPCCLHCFLIYAARSANSAGVAQSTGNTPATEIERSGKLSSVPLRFFDVIYPRAASWAL